MHILALKDGDIDLLATSALAIAIATVVGIGLVGYYRQSISAALVRNGLPPLSLKNVLIGVVILLFLLFIWPTLYRYEGDIHVYRINRLTGNVDRMYSPPTPRR